MKAISAHGHATREMTRASLNALSATGDPGKFGRMFPLLDGLVVSNDALEALAATMKDTLSPQGDTLPAGDNPKVPAGYTYLGQFIDHDITLDTTPLEVQASDPLATTNFRSPSVDLDSVYGQGPAVHPHLYQRDPATHRTSAKLLIGRAGSSFDPAGGTVPVLPNDLPRNQVGRALLGDERNDENLLVAQTHLLFLKFHNKVVDLLMAGQPSLRGSALFDEARRIVTWHYQWIVLFDFVDGRLTEPGLVKKIKHQGRRFYRFRSKPYMPAEFAAAAYRLGHSMVRERYSHNRVFRDGGVAPGTLGLLFNFTGKSGQIVGDLVDQGAVAQPSGPGPLRDLPSNWVIDWRRFFELGTPLGTPDFLLNPARRLDTKIVPALHTLPGLAGREASLAFRNLRRGVILGLPSGQDVAHAMGLPKLTEDQVLSGLSAADKTTLRSHNLHRATPLWYYVLKEAEVKHSGERLGPVGATIIAETFLGLVHGDHKSFLWLESNWKPTLPSATPGHFTMADMVRLVDDINPVG